MAKDYITKMNDTLNKYKYDASELFTSQDAIVPKKPGVFKVEIPQCKQEDDIVNIPANMSEYEKMYLSKIKSIVNTFIKKNHDYGSSVRKNYDKFETYGKNEGLKYVFGRIAEKYDRLENLIYREHNNHVNESITDTLIDMANYAILAAVSFDEHTCDELDNIMHT